MITSFKIFEYKEENQFWFIRGDSKKIKEILKLCVMNIENFPANFSFDPERFISDITDNLIGIYVLSNGIGCYIYNKENIKNAKIEIIKQRAGIKRFVFMGEIKMKMEPETWYVYGKKARKEKHLVPTVFVDDFEVEIDKYNL